MGLFQVFDRRGFGQDNFFPKELHPINGTGAPSKGCVKYVHLYENGSNIVYPVTDAQEKQLKQHEGFIGTFEGPPRLPHDIR